MTKVWTTEEIKARLELYRQHQSLQLPYSTRDQIAFREDAPEIIQQLLTQLERYEGALRQYADAANWCPSHDHSSLQDWWMPDGDGWQLAQKALEGDS